MWVRWSRRKQWLAPFSVSDGGGHFYLPRNLVRAPRSWSHVTYFPVANAGSIFSQILDRNSGNVGGLLALLSQFDIAARDMEK